MPDRTTPRVTTPHLTTPRVTTPRVTTPRRATLHLTVHRARHGTGTVKVVRPARPVERAELLDDTWYLNAYVDQDAAVLMAGLWTLAASSPRSLIHLPLRGAPAPRAGSRRLDLVLLHHSLQLAPSRWKELRGRLGPGRPQTVDVLLPEPGEVDHAAMHRADNRDRFHQSVHAETLFMTGSATVLRQGAEVFHEVARQGPGHTDTRTGYRHAHYCRSVDCDARFRDIHVEYLPEGDPR
ncbi:hypothetical protein [Streptomyces sp. NBC_00091]|uniref:hypothetical protein n=1 Tax=Streptomyces sp. NBC_00091 TaxID=2975648 RepID=UPI0022555C7F|nr:hypothetical protein [Streptomyces sp. NBC_00091]MCX5375169.1 hypothetical protein [Streptomyces sp. NBC_00091]